MTPDPLDRRRSRRRWWVSGLVLVAILVLVLIPLASSDPDGLERVAEDQGFIDQAGNVVNGLLSGYAIPGIEDPAVSSIVSGLVGIAIVALLIVGIGRLLARRRA